MTDKWNTIDQALAALRAGQVIIVTDDEDRENEGDLILAAEFASRENMNFLASVGKGLICLPLSAERAQALDLPPMTAYNTDNHETAFTVSVDHVETSTGISAGDRALTARKLADPASRPEDFRRPGHLFPLVARSGGVLVRPGHTEATVDLLRLAGLSPIGLCCEVMGPDGRMMRTPELFQLKEKYGLTMISIRQLQDWRRAHESWLEERVRAQLPTRHGRFTVLLFHDAIQDLDQLALVKGEPDPSRPVLTRLHSACLTGDVLGSLRCDCGDQLHAAMERIDQEGAGVLLYLNQEGRGIGLENKLRAYTLQDQGLDTVQANQALGFAPDERDYSAAAQMLKHLGIHQVRLLTNNPDKVSQLDQYGIQVKERLPLEIAPNPYDRHYLETKKEKMGHWLHLEG